MLFKVVVTFESVYVILKCDHSNESYWAVLSCGTVYYAVQGDSNFWVVGWNPKVWPFKWNLFGNTFTWNYLLLNFLQNENYNFFWNLTLFTFRGLKGLSVSLAFLNLIERKWFLIVETNITSMIALTALIIKCRCVLATVTQTPWKHNSRFTKISLKLFIFVQKTCMSESFIWKAFTLAERKDKLSVMSWSYFLWSSLKIVVMEKTHRNERSLLLVVFLSLSKRLKRFEGFFVSKQIKFVCLYFIILATNDNSFLN